MRKRCNVNAVMQSLASVAIDRISANMAIVLLSSVNAAVTSEQG